MELDEIQGLLETFSPPLTRVQVAALSRLLHRLAVERPSPAQETMTTDDLARLLRVSPAQVSIWREAHRWPCFKVGRTYRFTPDHVRQILTMHNPAGRQPAGPTRPRRRLAK